MAQLSDVTQAFFGQYEAMIKTSEGASTLYNDPFMFAGPQGVQAVRLDDFLKTLPKREGFFKAIGLASTQLKDLEETRLDDTYIMVKSKWVMQFVKGAELPVDVETAATYLLQQQGATLKIVFQLDHQNLMKVTQDLGLVPKVGN